MPRDYEDLIKRIEVLEEEVRQLKLQQSAIPTPKIEKERAFRPIEDVVAVKQPVVQREFVQEPPKLPKKQFDFERALGLWLPRVFMFILLLGVLWGLKVGMDNGYITNLLRTVMGYAGTVILYFVGMNYFKNKNKWFGLTLLGGLIALGILTTFAAHHLYGYLSFTVAFIVGVAYIALGLVLSERTKSETLTLFSAIGGFLLPFLLEGEGATSLQFCAYILLLFFSLFYVSLRQKHKYTFYVTFLLFHMTLLAFGVLDGKESDKPIIVGTALIQHVTLLFFYLRGNISRHVFSEALIYTNFVFALFWVQVLEANQGTMLYAAFALLYILIALYSFRNQDELLRGVFTAVAIFAISAFVLSFESGHMVIKIVSLLINGTVGLWIGLRYKTKRIVVTSAFIYVLSSLAVIFTLDFNRLVSLELIAWLVFLGTIMFNYYSMYQFRPSFIKRKELDQSLLVGQVISLLFIIHVTNVILLEVDIGYLTAMHVFILVLIVTLSAMYLFHKWDKGKYLVQGVLVEFLLIGIGMMSLGLVGYFGDENFYFNLFVQVVYVLILSILFFAIKNERFYIPLKEKLSKIAIGMQLVYFIYLNKWYFAFVAHNEWDLEYIYLAHTFLLFGFSFVSISIGRKMAWKFVRMAGILLIVICVLKLFILDLGSVSILIRAILFTIVGIVGLLYSRTLLKE
ncbi:DUF2339 domain-containing protein [Sporosarcina sp. CAU 1771]